jgi:Tol biopolymer transport system component
MARERDVLGIAAKRVVFFLLAVTVAALFWASALLPMDPSAQTTSPEGKIVYEKLGDIWVMNADGTDQTNLTNTPDIQEGQPAWSPDGTKIAFTGPGDLNEDNSGGLGDIYVMDADPSTNDATNLTNTPDDLEVQPSWAPSGAQLAFVREVGKEDLPGQIVSEQDDIFVMDANGENATNITQTEANEREPAWSPDGTKIAVAGVRKPTATATACPTATATATATASPTATATACPTPPAAGWEILTMDPDGQNETILTGDTFEGEDRGPDWSPDSTMVVFQKSQDSDEPSEIWAVNSDDGSGDTNLTNHPSYDTGPSWSPDGSEITFTRISPSTEGGQSDIYAMPAPTTLPPPDETASLTTSQDSDAMDFAASDVLLRAASAQTTSETTVRRLTTDGSSTEPDWGPNTAPKITNLRPAKDSTTTDRTPLIGAKVTDAQTDLAKSNITLFLDGTRIARTEFSYNRDTDWLKYTPETNLSLGEHTVKVVAQDPEGLITRRLWSFSIARP